MVGLVQIVGDRDLSDVVLNIQRNPILLQIQIFVTSHFFTQLSHLRAFIHYTLAQTSFNV